VTAYIIRRLAIGLLIILLVTMIVFFVIRLLPGDPLIIYLGQQATSGSVTAVQLEELRHEYGLDRPLIVQYGSWMNGLFHGNLGTSVYYRENITTLLADKLPITLTLGLTSFVLSTILGIILGVVAAIRRSSWIDTVVTSLSNLGITIPVFWLGLMLMYIFGLKLNWLPIAGYISPFEHFLPGIKTMVLPVICLGVTGLAGTARQTRSSMLEVIRQDYIRTAWSKGLRERAVIFRHALKISLTPVVTLMGIGIGMIFGGSVLVETVFAIPGIGRLLTQSIFAQDYTVIQSGTLVVSAIIVLVNLIVDISYGWIDPRVAYD
jgi:peptide/nickel transport system permease protein